MAALALLSAAQSCKLPTAAPTESWQVTFVNEQSSAYGGSSCTGVTNNPYCRTWAADVYQFDGAMSRKGDRWGLTLSSGSRYSASYSMGTNPVRVDLGESGIIDGCINYSLSITTLGDSVAGTFSYSPDCHGASRTGRFTGHR